MNYFESEVEELKESVNETLCKEMVSFLNTFGGVIYIGVKDNGEVIGVKEIDKSFKQISDIITDTIEPSPIGLIEPRIIYDNKLPVIQIDVKKGLKPLYCIKKHGFSPSGCYLRIGSACKSMPSDEIQKRYFKSLANQDLMLQTFGTSGLLSFNTLKNYYSEAGYHLDDNSFEQNFKLRTIDGYYNKLAELLSDHNMIPIIVVKFNGIDKTSISQRNDYGGGCLLFTYEKIKNRFSSENICKSITTVRPRIDKYLFDNDAINEAIINALVHNDWTISQPLFAIYSNRIEILSHGGLPQGETLEDFFNGISHPRNDMLMTIFNQMTISEHTGHGVPIIVKKYGRDAFEITDNYIKVIIPFDEEVMQSITNVVNSADNSIGDIELERSTISIILENDRASANTISLQLNVSKRTIERILSKLKNEGIIERIGGTRGKWIVKK